MKHSIYMAAIALSAVCLTSCNDDFMQRDPHTEITQKVYQTN